LVVLMILLLLILLIFFVPYGVDAAYEEGAVSLRVAAGPFRVTLYPKKPPTEKQRRRAEKKQEKKEAKKAQQAKKPEESAEEQPKGKNETIKVRKKLPMDFEHLMLYLKLAAHALRRFFRSFTIDLFRLHYTAGSMDPYATAMQYGYACSAAEALPSLAGEIIHVRKKDVVIASDFTADHPAVGVRIVLTLQLYKLVHMAVAFLTEYLIWNRRLRREKASASISEREEENGRQQDQ